MESWAQKKKAWASFLVELWIRCWNDLKEILLSFSNFCISHLCDCTWLENPHWFRSIVSASSKFAWKSFSLILIFGARDNMPQNSANKSTQFTPEEFKEVCFQILWITCLYIIFMPEFCLYWQSVIVFTKNSFVFTKKKKKIKKSCDNLLTYWVCCKWRNVQNFAPSGFPFYVWLNVSA